MKVLPGPGIKDLTQIPRMDVTLPEFMLYSSTVFPFVSNMVSSGATLHPQLDEPGPVYYAILTNAARATIREVQEPISGPMP